MRKKTLIVIGLMVAFFIVQGCTSKPEKGLLARYFNAVTLNDNETMSSMALSPFQPDMVSWEIVSISPEEIKDASLPELNKIEGEAKKAQDAQIGPTLDADALLKDAQDEKDLARSAAGKAAAQRKIDELQLKYDAENGKMQELKKAYNAAKAAAAAEEEMTMFSLGQRELATVRELTGKVHSKNVEVAIKTKAGGTKNYRLNMRQYMLQDEVNNVPHRGRWVIIKFEPIG
jgi:hypothetical protein